MWWPPNIASYANSVVIWIVPGIYHNDSILPFFRFIIIVAADNEMVFPFRWLTLWKGFSLQVEYINMYVADGWCLTFIRLDRIVSQLVLPQSHVPHVNNRANNRQWQLEPQPKSSVTRFTWSDPGLRMIWRKSFQSPRSCSAIRLIAQQYSIYSNSPVGSFTFLHSTWHQRTRVLKSIWMKKLRIFHAFQIPFYCFKLENDLLMTMRHNPPPLRWSSYKQNSISVWQTKTITLFSMQINWNGTTCHRIQIKQIAFHCSVEYYLNLHAAWRRWQAHNRIYSENNNNWHCWSLVWFACVGIE